MCFFDMFIASFVDAHCSDLLHFLTFFLRFCWPKWRMFLELFGHVFSHVWVLWARELGVLWRKCVVFLIFVMRFRCVFVVIFQCFLCVFVDIFCCFFDNFCRFLCRVLSIFFAQFACFLSVFFHTFCSLFFLTFLRILACFLATLSHFCTWRWFCHSFFSGLSDLLLNLFMKWTFFSKLPICVGMNIYN